jgi:hypothetical protein
VEVLDPVIVDLSPIFVDRLVSPSLPATARAAFLLHRKPAYLPHDLKAYPIKRPARVSHTKVIDPADNDRTNPLKNFGKLSMPEQFQNASHPTDKLALLLSLWRAQNESLTI